MRATLLLVGLLAGCVSDPQKRDAINDVNQEFRQQYERILAESGTRRYKAKRPQAFNALRTVLLRLGMRIGDQSQEIGYLNVFAPAPTPLDRAEWDEAQKNDLPVLREIATRHIGLLGYLVKFEPEGLDIVINAAAIEVAGGTDVSLTMRMREVAPARSGMPRRDYPPPSAVRKGLDKIWRELERELGAL
jgi:hypothetical protein